METISIFTGRSASKKDLAGMVKQLRGHWQSHRDRDGKLFEEGVVQGQGSSHVFIYVEENVLVDFEREAVSQVEVDGIGLILGKPPLSVVHIAIGHGKGSNELAFSVADLIAKRFEGIIVFGGMKWMEELYEAGEGRSKHVLSIRIQKD